MPKRPKLAPVKEEISFKDDRELVKDALLVARDLAQKLSLTFTFEALLNLKDVLLDDDIEEKLAQCQRDVVELMGSANLTEVLALYFDLTDEDEDEDEDE
jgi:hypothetical protein